MALGNVIGTVLHQVAYIFEASSFCFFILGFGAALEGPRGGQGRHCDLMLCCRQAASRVSAETLGCGYFAGQTCRGVRGVGVVLPMWIYSPRRGTE